MPEQSGDGARRNYPTLNKPPTRLAGRYYSVAEVAEILDRSKQRVLTYLGEGRLTGVMVGNVWLIAACSVERLAELMHSGQIRDALNEAEEITG